METTVTVPRAAFHAQGFLDGIHIERVDDRGDAFPHQGVGCRIDFDVGRLRNLFDANYIAHGALLCPPGGRVRQNARIIGTEGWDASPLWVGMRLVRPW